MISTLFQSQPRCPSHLNPIPQEIAELESKFQSQPRCPSHLNSFNARTCMVLVWVSISTEMPVSPQRHPQIRRTQICVRFNLNRDARLTSTHSRTAGGKITLYVSISTEMPVSPQPRNLPLLRRGMTGFNLNRDARLTST